jgi:hypothetical protein
MTMTEGRTPTEAVLDILRRPATDHAVFRGFGPLIVGVAFVLLMIVLLGSVAPEQIVEQPVDPATEEDR